VGLRRGTYTEVGCGEQEGMERMGVGAKRESLVAEPSPLQKVPFLSVPGAIACRYRDLL